MKICIPVQERNGLDSLIEPHFPHAHTLLFFDTGTHALHYLDLDSPDDQPDETMLAHAVLCGSINRHTLRSLIDQGITVYGTEAQTVFQAITQLGEGQLEAVAIAGRHGTDHCGDHAHQQEQEAGRTCCGGSLQDDPDHECCGGECCNEAPEGVSK